MKLNKSTLLNVVRKYIPVCADSRLKDMYFQNTFVKNGCKHYRFSITSDVLDKGYFSFMAAEYKSGAVMIWCSFWKSPDDESEYCVTDSITYQFNNDGVLVYSTDNRIKFEVEL